MSDAPHSLLPADIHEPYIGLKPYTEAERDRFFGRERDAQLLINKLFPDPLKRALDHQLGPKHLADRCRRRLVDVVGF